VASTIEVPVTDGTTLPLYDVSPDGDPAGAVVVIQEAFGVNDHIEDVARRFADAGFRAVAPHLFHRTGDPRLGYERLTDAMPHMQALTADGLAADIDATLDYLEADGFPPARIGFVGFCMGGTVAMIAAATRSIGAAVTFYGGGILEGRFGGPPLVELAPHLRAPWIGFYGDEDQGIPIQQVEALGQAAADATVPTEIFRYPSAGHGFHCDVRASYDEVAALDAWPRCVAWLREHLAPPAAHA
jgi:carboxymethylenebutenolidase